MTNCVVAHNRNRLVSGGVTYGAGVYGTGSGRVLFNGCELAGNWLTLGLGAAVYATCPVVLRNCLVRGHTANGAGGQAALCLSGGGTLENCTMVDNTTVCGLNNAGGTIGVTNSILWNNGDDAAGAVNLGYSDFQTSDSFWTNGINGCLTADPRFVNTNAANYRLRAASPCVGAGTVLGWMLGAVDLDGVPRVRGPVVDLGCYQSVMLPGMVLMVR